MKSSRQIIGSLFSIVLIVSMVLNIIAQPSLVRAQVIANSIAPAAMVTATPMNSMVNTLNGNWTYQYELFSVANGQHPFTLTLTYNSLRADEDWGYSPGWQMNHNIYYEEVGQDVLIHHGNGRVDRYLRQGNTFVSPVDVYDTLTALEDGGYKLYVLAEQADWYFDAPEHTSITRMDYLSELDILYTYDENQQLLRLETTTGVALNFVYDDLGQWRSVTLEGNNETANLVYDFNGNLTTIIDAERNFTTLTYQDNRIISITDPNNHVLQILYDNTGRVIETLFANLLTIIQYDVQTTTISQSPLDTPEQARVTQHQYDENGQITSITDPLGNTTSYTWNQAGNLLEVIDAQSIRRVRYEYNEDGLPIVTETPILRSEAEYIEDTINYSIHIYGPIFERWSEDVEYFRYNYNVDGYLTTTSAPNDAWTAQIEYDEFGNVIRMVQPDGSEMTFTYDAVGNPISHTNAIGEVSTASYDGNGLPLTESMPDGSQRQFEYDSLQRLVRQIDVHGNSMRVTYDGNGNITQYTDGNGNTTNYRYNAYNQIVEVIDALGNSTQHEYDVFGNLIQSTDALGQVTTFTYDSLDRLISETDALGNSYQYQYDSLGNVIAVTQPTGDVIRYEYDEGNRNTRILYPDGTDVTFEYNFFNQVTQMTDATGTTTYEYDMEGDLLAYTDSNGNRQTYTYDPLGFPETVVYPDGSQLVYDYDPVGNLQSIQTPDGEVTYDYLVSGRLNERVTPDGIRTQFNYDDAYQLSSIQHFEATDLLLAEFTYEYDDAQQIIRTTTNGIATQPQIVDYAYDPLNRLVSAEYDDGTFEQFSYDAVDNRTALITPEGVTTYSYDIGNQLNAIQHPDATQTTFEYDARGNVVQQQAPDATTFYRYDFEDNLTSVVNNTIAIDYVYNGLDQRIAELENGLRTNFVNHTPGAIDLLIAEESDGIYINYWRDWSTFAESNPGGTLYRLTDHLNSTRAIVTPDGSSIAAQHYSAFGQTLLDSDTGRIGYAGEPQQSETGLVFLRARYMQPETGRFISHDDINGFVDTPQTMNGYTYVHNNPINDIDPTGLCPASGWSKFGQFMFIFGSSFLSAYGALLVIPGTIAATPVAFVLGVFAFIAVMYSFSAKIMSLMDGDANRNNNLTELIATQAGADPLTAKILGALEGFITPGGATRAPGNVQRILDLNGFIGNFNNVNDALTSAMPPNLPGSNGYPPASMPNSGGALPPINSNFSGGSGGSNNNGSSAPSGNNSGSQPAGNNGRTGSSEGNNPSNNTSSSGDSTGNTSSSSGNGSSGSSSSGSSGSGSSGSSGNGSSGSGSSGNGSTTGNTSGGNSSGNTGSSTGNGSGTTGQVAPTATNTPTSTPTPTPTFTPTFTPTNTPTTTITVAPTDPAPQILGTVCTSGSVNIRASATTNSAIVTSVPNGTSFEIIGQNTDALWYNIRLADGTEGWIADFLLCEEPLVGVIETPEPIATSDAEVTVPPPADMPAGGILQNGTYTPSVISPTGSCPADAADNVPDSNDFNIQFLEGGFRLTLTYQGETIEFIEARDNFYSSLDAMRTLSITSDTSFTFVIIQGGCILIVEWTLDSGVAPTPEPTLDPADIGEFQCPESFDLDTAVFYPSIFGLTLEEYLRDTGLADVFDGNFPPDVNVENPEAGVYIVSESDGTYSFSARFEEISPDEYNITVNVTFPLPPDNTPCSVTYSVTLVNGELVISPNVVVGNVDFTASDVPSTPINPLQGLWTSFPPVTSVEGCGGFGDMIAGSIGTGFGFGGNDPFEYEGDFTVDTLRDLFNSEDPLPAGTDIENPSPNIYTITISEPEGNIFYELRVVSPTRIEFTLIFEIFDPEIAPCTITTEGYSEYAEEVMPTATPELILPQEGLYQPDVITINDCDGESARIESQLEATVVMWSFQTDDNGDSVTLTNPFGTETVQLITGNTYQSPVAPDGSSAIITFVDSTEFTEVITFSPTCEATVTFTLVN